MTYLENVDYFLDYQGHTGEATQVLSLESTLSDLQYRSIAKRSRQTTLKEYFPQPAGDSTV